MASRPFRISKLIATSARCGGWAAWVASLTVLVVAWAPLLGSLHQALVRHVVCEHGDLIEPDERGTQPSHSTPSASAGHDSAGSASPSVGAGARPSIHGHTHCSVGTLARNVATVGASSTVGALLAEGRAVSRAARDANPVRSVLSNAPKTSPPASQQGTLL